MNKCNTHFVEKKSLVPMRMTPCRRRLKQTSTVGGLALHLGNNDPYVILLPSHPSSSFLIAVDIVILTGVGKAREKQ
jgi:hypothetical protein